MTEIEFGHNNFRYRYRVSGTKSEIRQFDPQSKVWNRIFQLAALKLGEEALSIRRFLDSLSSVDWPGGDSPVREGTLIVRYLRNGDYSLSRAGDERSHDWQWIHEPEPLKSTDIVSYALVDDSSIDSVEFQASLARLLQFEFSA